MAKHISLNLNNNSFNKQIYINIISFCRKMVICLIVVIVEYRLDKLQAPIALGYAENKYAAESLNGIDIYQQMSWDISWEPRFRLYMDSTFFTRTRFRPEKKY